MKRRSTSAGIKNHTLLSSVILPFILAALTFVIIYKFDNKYTRTEPQALNGVLLLDNLTLERYPVLYLVNGWEYYGGRLLTPKDFERRAEKPLPDQYVFIGQYGGFEAGDLSASPHGSASYRLNIIIPDEIRPYKLELPEIFSSYRIYINGKEAAAMGTPEPANYRPETGSRTLSFEAGKRIEILVAVSDFSHFYSGMVYPPAFGSPDGVNALLNARLVFRSILCAVALAIGFFSALTGFINRNKMLAFLYALMCLFFIGYVSYPIIYTFARSFPAIYAIENFSFYVLLTTVVLIQKRVSRVSNSYSRCFALFGATMCLAALFMPFLYSHGDLKVMLLYSNLVGIYKWVTAGFITFTAVKTSLNNDAISKIILGGITILDCGLVMDRLLPMFEPVISCWFPETASFCLILAIGFAIEKEAAMQYWENAVLNERAESLEQLTVIQKSFNPILKQKIEEAKTIRHDFRHHLVMINGFLNNRQYEKLQQYVSQYQNAMQFDEPIRYSHNDVANILAYYYKHLANKFDIDLTLKLEIEYASQISDADLCSLLSNLLENGVEACQRQKSNRRFINFTATQKKSTLAIKMENSSDGNLALGNPFHTSSKGIGRKGYGLESIKSVAKRYSGAADFYYDELSEAFCSTVVLTL